MPMIETLKRVYDVKYFFWVAETQGNGNIHFHLIIDNFVHHAQVRGLWNKYLSKLGYIEAFRKKHGHTNPNSTDIHIVGGFQQSIKYVVKYVQKSESKRPISGRLHGMSKELRELRNYTTVIDTETAQFITEASNTKGSRVFRGDMFTVIYCQVYELESFKNSSIRLSFDIYLEQVYLTLYMNEYSFTNSVTHGLERFIDPKAVEIAENVISIQNHLDQLELFEKEIKPLKRLIRINDQAIKNAN